MRTLQTSVAMRSCVATPISFTQNAGQWPDSVLYRADADGVNVWILKSGVIYQFTRSIDQANTVTSSADPDTLSAVTSQLSAIQPSSFETMLVTATFLGSNPLPDVIAEGLAESQCNYFLGDDPLMWRTDVPSYSAVTLRNVYDGIDLHFFAGADGRLAYKYSTSADANTSQVKMAYKGLEMVSADADGRLIGKTKWGDICGLLTAPVTMTDGASARIEPRFDGEAPERITHTVLPQSSPEAVSLVFSTYLGGANLDVGYDIAVDGSGCAYVIGFTMSADFPTQTAYDPVFDGGDYDVFVTKLSQAGDGLAFSTFLGGSLDESGTGIAVDASGCVYVTGNTYSSDFRRRMPMTRASTGRFRWLRDQAFFCR